MNCARPPYKFKVTEQNQAHTIELRSIVIPRSKELGQFKFVEFIVAYTAAKCHVTKTNYIVSSIPGSLFKSNELIVDI